MDSQMGKLLFKSNLLLITITYNKKYFITVTYYQENKVIVIILHIITFEKQLSNSLTMCHIATK